MHLNLQKYKILSALFFILINLSLGNSITATESKKSDFYTNLQVVGAQVLSDGSSVIFSRKNISPTTFQRANETIILTLDNNGKETRLKFPAYLERLEKIPNTENILLTLKDRESNLSKILLFENGKYKTLFEGFIAISDISSTGKHLLLMKSELVPSSDLIKNYLLFADITGNEIKQWPLKTSKQWRDGDPMHLESWLVYRFSKDGKNIFSATQFYEDGSLSNIRLLNNNPLENKGKIIHKENVYKFTMLSNDRNISITRKTLEVNLSLKNGKKWKAYTPKDSYFKDLKTSPDQSLILTVSSYYKKNFTVWNSLTGRPILQWNPESSAVESLKPLTEKFNSLTEREQKMDTLFVDFLSNEKILIKFNQPHHPTEIYFLDLNKTDELPVQYSHHNNNFIENKNELFSTQNTYLTKYIQLTESGFEVNELQE